MKRTGFYFLCLWIGAVLFTGTGAAQAAEFEVQVNARGLVSFNAGTGRTPLTQILTRLSQKACVNIFLPGQIPAVSVAGSFQNIPIEEAVARLLGPASFAVVYPGGTGATGSLSLYTDDTIQSTGADAIVQADMDGAAAGRGRHRPKSSGRIAHQAAPGSLNPEFDRGHTNQGSKRTEHGKTRATASVEPFAASSGTTSGSGTTSASGTAAANAAAQAGNSGTQDNSENATGTLSETDSGVTDSTARQIAKLKYQIEKLTQAIDSGRADQFQATWTAVKDKNYVYNHQDDLAAKQKRLAELTGN